MDTIELGRSGVRVSRLGIGAMTWGDSSKVRWWSPAKISYGPTAGIQDEKAAVAASWEAGVTFIDSAAMYGGGQSETHVGILTKGSDMMVATKFPPTMFTRAESLPRCLEQSLDRLQRKTVDLYQIHYPVAWMPIDRLMDLMADAYKAGKIRAVGVSNYTAPQLRQAFDALRKHGIALASNQVEYSLLHRQPETDGVLETCRELGISLIAYMPLAMGALTGKYSRQVKPGGIRKWIRGYWGRDAVEVDRVVERLRQIGQKQKKSAAQVALRWLIEQNGVIPIPGAKTGAQARENAGALACTLTKAEVQELDKLTRVWR